MNRYMMINPPEEWKMPENEQVGYDNCTSTVQVPNKLQTANPYIVQLVKAIGKQRHPRQKYLLTVKGLLLLESIRNDVK